MKLRILVTLLSTGVVIMVGCTGETGMSVNLSSALGQTSDPVIERHPSGRISASGQVQPGTTTRVGPWVFWYDDERGAKRWEGDYVNGVIDKTKSWREWNIDGSVRADSQDR